MPLRYHPLHYPFAHLGNGERERLFQALDRRAHPSEDIIFDLVDPYFGTRFRDMDEDDYFDRHHRQQPVRHHANAGLDEEHPLVAQPRREPMALGKAMKSLHKQVGKAEDCFRNFMEEFDNDTQTLKNYAGANILKDLWKKKVKGKKEDDEDGDYGEGNGAENYQKKFDEQKKDLLDAMNGAVSSVLKREIRSVRNEASKEKLRRAERLLQKVSMAQSQIRGLLESAPKGQQACRDLLAELGMLKSFVDPEAEMNKDLFKDSGCDDGGESSGSGGSGSGSGGQDWN